MSPSTEAVDLPDMGKREAPSKQINVRLRMDLYNEAEAVRAAQPYNPTWTQVVETLLQRWVDEHRAQQPDAAKPARGARK